MADRASTLVATADLRGSTIQLALTWSDPNGKARLRVVRRRHGYPSNVDDGLRILDLSELFKRDGQPWACIEKNRFLLVNAPTEGGLLQAEVVAYYSMASDSRPARVQIQTCDGDTKKTGVEPARFEVSSLDDGQTTRYALHLKSGSVHIAVASTRSGDPDIPNRFEWIQPGGETLSVQFHRHEHHVTTSTVRSIGNESIEIVFETYVKAASAPDAIIRSVSYKRDSNRDTGGSDESVVVTDREPSMRHPERFTAGLEPGETYYYAAWNDEQTDKPSSPAWTAFATATADYGFSRRLLELLPAVHRYYDDSASGSRPGSEQAGAGQLERFLQVMGPALDRVRSLGDSIGSLHDAFETRADLLPLLGHGIGWEVDRTQPVQRQRADILLAPEVFATVGTVGNIEAMVQRSTGWDCHVKEFAKNVFLTNAVEPIRLREIWQIGLPAPPVGTTQTQVTLAMGDSVDGRPCAVLVPDSGDGELVLFWHSTRPDPEHPSKTPRRRIWMQRAGSGMPRPVVTDSDIQLDQNFSDEWPTAVADGSSVLLFWASNRSGSYSIWMRRITLWPLGKCRIDNATRRTEHPSGDYCPSVARDKDGKLWLFWQSSRRGATTDIWAITKTPKGEWSSPRLVTAGRPRDEMPFAFFDINKQLCLVWSADFGDRSRILFAKLGVDLRPINNSVETVSSAPLDGTSFRDVTPCAIAHANEVHVFWSSNRDGTFRLMTSLRDGNEWTPVEYVRSYRHEEHEPFALAEEEELSLFYSTSEGGEVYQSRTVDFDRLSDVRTGQRDDRWHYTYSFPAGDPPNYDTSSCYAFNVVGLYVTPDSEASTTDVGHRVRWLVEPFRPVTVTFVQFIQPLPMTERVYVPQDIGEATSYSGNFVSTEVLGEIEEIVPVPEISWILFRTNRTDHLSYDPSSPETTAATLIHRIWHPIFGAVNE